ncbi:hypothetical protein MNV49_005423 [Pseudohyphozyma bogoriensis]|nr:hypothetical protein MNV49_005423 [Pseudohyphozyma bogoriensis]
MSSPETDAFHLFHLSDLTFDLSSPATLTSAQLCLALFNPDYDKNVHEAKLKRTWRARREKTRPRIGKVPIGNLASEDERNAHPGDRWPGFELCDLSFTVPDEAGLDELESWQLAASLLVSGGPTHHNTDIPFELAEALSVVLIHNVPRYSVFEDIRHLLLSLSQIAPAGLKMSFGHGPSQRSRQSGAEVSTCFAAYLVPEDAMEVEKRLKGQRFGGEILSSEMAHPPRFSDGRPKDRMWRWQNFDKHFKELWSRGSIRVARLENGLPALHQRSPSPARNIKRRQSSPLPPYGFAPPAPPPPPSVSKKDPRDDEPVPWVVAQPLFQLFVSNLPEFVRIGEMREFFDDCVGLCGITLGTPNAKFHNCAGWLIFTEKSERDAAQVQLHNQRFPGERAPLYLEKAEPRKTTTHLYWRDMSKEFRSKFRDGPGMPSTNGPATQSSPISPHDHMRGSFSQYPTPASISTPSPAPGSLVPGENPANGPAKNKIHPSRLGLIPEGPRSTTEIDEALASLIPFQPVAAFPPPAPTGTNASPLPTGPRFSHAPKRDSTMVDPPLMSRSPSNEKRAKEDMPIPTGPRSLSIKGFGTKSPTRPPSAPLPPSPSPPKFSLPFKMPEPPKVVASLLSQLGGSLSSGPNGAAEEIVDAQAPSVHKESSEVQNGDVQMEEEEDVKPNIVPESN